MTGRTTGLLLRKSHPGTGRTTRSAGRCSAPVSLPLEFCFVPRALLALAIGAFGLGTTEFVVMGMLPEIADGLDVSVSADGILISA